MNKNTVAEALRALASSDKSRSATARLRDVFSDVEIALKAGVSRAAILETLNAQGFVMTAKSFESAIYRIRKKHLSISSSAAPAPVEPTPIPVASEKPVVETKAGQNPLRALSGTPKDGNHIPKTNFEVE